MLARSCCQHPNVTPRSPHRSFRASCEPAALGRGLRHQVSLSTGGRRGKARRMDISAPRAAPVELSQNLLQIPQLVSAEWLDQRLGSDNLKILDGSWYLEMMNRNAVEEFRAERIPGSAFFDVDGIADTESPFLHMLPSPAEFAAAASAMGITQDTAVVVYDCKGVFSSPRVWWTFKVFGYKNVAILDGGLPAWKAGGFQVDKSDVAHSVVHAPVAAMKLNQTNFSQQTYTASEEICGLPAMMSLSKNGSSGEQIIDARPAARFKGAAPEPRANLRRGCMPGSINVPFTEVLTKDGYMKPHEELKATFVKAGVDFNKQLIVTCGSGLTACIVVLALQLTGKDKVAVYDGSWMEWGSREDTIIV